MSIIIILLTFLLKTTKLSEKLALKAFSTNDNEIVDGYGSRANKTVVNLSKNKKSRNLIYIPNIIATEEFTFLTPNVNKIFNYLRLVIIEALILQHFDLKSHI